MPFDKRLHVVVGIRQAFQPALVIDEMLDRVGIERGVSHQIHQHAGIEITGPRAHRNAASGRHAHGGIDGTTFLDRAQACTAPQMRDDQPLRQILASVETIDSYDNP